MTTRILGEDNLALQPGVVVTVSVTYPTGGGAVDPAVLLNETACDLDGQTLVAFAQSKTFDTYDGQNQASFFDWYELAFPAVVHCNCLEMTMGLPYRDGGWWTSLAVEFYNQEQQAWTPVENLTINPPYNVALSNAENVVNSLKVVLTGNEAEATPFECYLVIRPYGPAGGRIHMLAAPDRQALEVNGKTVMLAKNAAMQFGVASYQADQQDVSFWLKRGEIPMAQRVTDDAGLCGGAFLYHGTLLPGERHTCEFDFFVHPLEQRYLAAFRRCHEQTYEAKLASVLEDWRKRLDSVQLQVPDERFQHAYTSLLAQFLMDMVRQEVRIATVRSVYYSGT